MNYMTKILDAACGADPDLAFERAVMGDMHMYRAYKPINLMQRISQTDSEAYVRLLNDLPVTTLNEYFKVLDA